MAGAVAVNQIDAMSYMNQCMRARRLEARGFAELMWQAVVLRRWSEAYLFRLYGYLGITVENRELLEWLLRESAPIPVAVLARRMNRSRQQVHQALQRLPDPRWVRRTRRRGQRCGLKLSLSASGKRFARRVRAAEIEMIGPAVLGCRPDDLAKCAYGVREVIRGLSTSLMWMIDGPPLPLRHV